MDHGSLLLPHPRNRDCTTFRVVVPKIQILLRNFVSLRVVSPFDKVKNLFLNFCRACPIVRSTIHTLFQLHNNGVDT